MAKGIEINGQMRGKRGGVVYYRAAGQQISRARNFAPSNPKTAKQAVQRMVLATASKMAAALRPIVNHSWEGVREGEISVRHFQSRSMAFLRGVAASYLNTGASAVEQPANFAIKGAPVAGGVGGLQVSSGRLRVPVYSVADAVLTLRASVPSRIGDAEGYQDMLSRLGMVPGDQLTILLYQTLEGSTAAKFGDEINLVDRYRYARVVFRPVADIDFAEPIEVNDGGFFNEMLVERVDGVMPAILSQEPDAFSFDLDMHNDWHTAAAAVIISHKTEEGKYYYSNSRMEADRTYLDANNAWPVYESYMATSTPVEVGDNLYLQNAVAAPFTGAGE